MRCARGRCPERDRYAACDCTCARIRALGAKITYRPTGGVRGWYDPERHEVVVDSNQPWPAQHATLAHELAHLEAGDSYRPGWWADLHEDGMEDRADEVAARDVIALHRLAQVVLVARDHQDAAERLGVDVDLLTVRLDTLTEAERQHLALATRPDGVPAPRRQQPTEQRRPWG